MEVVVERLLKYFVPEKYVLDLEVNKYCKEIGGKVTVVGEALKETIKFHAVKLIVTDVLVDGKNVSFKIEEDMVVISNIKLGKTEVELCYYGTLNENMLGAYLSTYKLGDKTEIIVATQFESHYAREAFPCIDEPAAKAVFELAITVPENSVKTGDIVLANTPEKSRKTIKEATKALSVTMPMIKIEFEPTPRMSTYLLTFVIGKFHGKTIKNAHGVEITTYCALNQEIDSVDFANEIAAKSLEFYDDNFGVPYPLKKCTQVALPDFDAGAMENWGLVTYRESMILANSNATIGTKKGVALTVAHELSHQWFGDLVTMEWWDDLWLNESFASVMEYYAVDYIHPEYKIFESFFVGDCYAALIRDAYSGVQSVHQEVSNPEEISTLFDSAIVYAKGARLMLMLIRLMGWDNFTKGIQDYFKKYQYKNTIGDDLWNALAPYADFDPKELMYAFIDKPGYPVITNEADNFKKFSQKKFSLDSKMVDSDWPLPKITEDMSGHYILNLSEEEFKERLDAFDELELEEKIRLLIDRDLITKSGMQSAGSLVPLVMKFKNEDTAAVWNKVAGLVANLKTYVDDESEEEKRLKKYCSVLVDDKLNQIGIVTRAGDDENIIRMRANLLGLDYYAEDKERLKELAGMYKDNYEEMDTEIRDDILSAKIYTEPKYVGEFLAKYEEIADPEIKFDYLAAAASAKDENELKKVLKLLGDTKKVKPQDQFYLFLWLYRNPKSKKQVFDWLTSNWEKVKKMSGDKSLDYYPTYIARLARTTDELNKYQDFFGPMRNDLSLKRAISIGENEIKARIRNIEKNRETVKKALDEITLE